MSSTFKIFSNFVVAFLIFITFPKIFQLILWQRTINCTVYCRVYSGTVAGAREAFFYGVPSISVSYDWYVVLLILNSMINYVDICYTSPKFAIYCFYTISSSILYCLACCVILVWELLTIRVGCKSNTQDYTLAAEACLPIISAVSTEIRNHQYPQGCFLNVDLPTNIANHKVVKHVLGATVKETPVTIK